MTRQTIKEPSKQYLALLDIKAVIRKWQDIDFSDTAALKEIERVILEINR